MLAGRRRVVVDVFVLALVARESFGTSAMRRIWNINRKIEKNVEGHF